MSNGFDYTRLHSLPYHSSLLVYMPYRLPHADHKTTFPQLSKKKLKTHCFLLSMLGAHCYRKLNRPTRVGHKAAFPQLRELKTTVFRIFFKLRESGSTRPQCNLNHPTHVGHKATFPQLQCISCDDGIV